MIKKLFLFITVFFNLNASSEEFYPENLLYLDSFFSHHVLLAEKSTHTLYLYKSNKENYPELVKTFKMATGKKPGDKTYQGDFKTPEGVYHFLDFLSHEDLIKRMGDEGEKYGAGSFVMNYPNFVDKLAKKTGGGIWLHSTNDETRIENGLDSRGCIVIDDKNLKDVSKYIELDKTAVVITHEVKYLAKSTFDKKRETILNFIVEWKDSWQSENIEEYLSHYDNNLYSDYSRSSYKDFKTYKKAVFSAKGSPEILIKNLSIQTNRDYAVVIFEQTYSSNSINDIGKKTLYLKLNEFYKWKIINETWNKVNYDTENKLAFNPSMRFFKQETIETEESR